MSPQITTSHAKISSEQQRLPASTNMQAFSSGRQVINTADLFAVNKPNPSQTNGFKINLPKDCINISSSFDSSNGKVKPGKMMKIQNPYQKTEN